MNIIISILIGLLISAYVVYKIGTSISEEMGKMEAENDRLKKDMDIAKKRAEEMAKDLSREDVVDDLRNGKF
jgi:hypothetical protein